MGKPFASSGQSLTAERLARSGNALLVRLDEADRSWLAERAALVTLERGAVMTRPDEPIAAAHFIESGIASVIKPDGRGERTEICMFGPETLSGGAIVTADGRWPYLTFVQTQQLEAVEVRADALQAATARSAALFTALVRAMHVQMVQIAEGLVSAAWQRLDARIARWLLMCRDRLGSDRIEVTHEFIALMVGAQRTGITAALHGLEGHGLIAAARGVVVIRDAPALEQLADGSYGTAERERVRLTS